MAMATRRSINKDENFYKRVLNRSHQRFLEDLDPVSVLDLFLEKDYLLYTQVRDIQEQRLTSDKTREIIKKVGSKGVQGYKTFKAVLRESHQEHLAEFLVKQEKILEREVQMAEKEKAEKHKPVAPAQSGNKRIPDDRELSSISAHIGMNWEMLGPFLGVPTPTIDQIKLDNSTTRMKIYRLFYVWRGMRGSDATVENLLAQMKMAPSAVNINWDAVNETVREYDKEEMVLKYRNANRNTLQSANGARPKTTDISQHQANDQAEAINRMQQLRIDRPAENVGGQNQGDQYRPESLMAGKHNEDTFHSGQFQTQQSYNPSLAAMQGDFGKTHVQGEIYSNEYGPDLSGRSFFSENRPDGQSGNTNDDEPDAARRRSLEREYNQNLQPQTFTVTRTVGNSSRTQAAAASTSDTTQGTGGGNTKERDKRLKDTFDSEQGMKGRLKLLNDQNLKDLLSSCGNEAEHKGGYGDIFVSKCNIPGLDMRVVLKKIECSNDEDVHKMRSITNEKLASRTMHYGIVPLLAMGCDSDKRTYYFLTPYLENGDLFHAIEKDNMKLQKKEEVTLDVDTRLRILFQITSAVDFLHTPVKNFRGAIIHMDIKALNIVLDKCNNARLIDFGLAREMREGHDSVKTTMKQLPHTPGHFKTIRHAMLTKYADCHNLGVVIRQLLTGKEPFIKGENELRDWTENKIKTKLLGIWKNDKKQPFEVAKDLAGLSAKCLKDEQLTSTNILREIKTCIQTRNIRCWQRPIENASAADSVSKCEICMENQAVSVQDELILHASNCHDAIDVCVSCMLHSYCNPLRCHSCDKSLLPTIGHGWAALLMAGNDTKNRKAAKGFVKDITDVHEVITSKFPLVMGVRKEHVAIVRPEKPGNAEKFKGKNGQLDEAFKMLKEINNTQTLLIYFSGHYYGGKGFQLGSDEEFLSLEELQTKVLSCLSGVDYKSPTFPLSSKRLIVFLDCCSAPGMKVPRFEEKSCLSLVQLNACRPNQEAYGDAENGSKFTLFFKQGLTGRALGKQCYNIMEGKIKQCQECELSGDLVTLQDLNKYITRHLKPYETSYQTVIYYDNASDLDTKIGYAIQYSIGLRFTFKLGDDEKRNSIQQRMFTNMISLRTILSDKFIEVMQPGSSEEPPLETEGVRDILCIEIEHGPKYVHRDELDSLERVMGAWYAKRDLIVSLRRLSDIRNGKVGMFLPAGYSVKPIKEYLGQNECFQELGPNSEEDTVYSVKLESLSEIAVQEDNPSLEKFGSILVDLEDALSKEKEYKMLHIIFPGAHGKQRNDFICFQIVKQNEED